MFDVNSNEYIAPAGNYEIQVAASLNDVKLKKSIKVKGVKYTADDRVKLASYFVADPEDAPKAKTEKTVKVEKKATVNVDELFTHEDFAKLYGKPLPEDFTPVAGTFSILNNINEAAAISPLCVKIREKMVERIVNDAKKRGRSENDPSVKIGICGCTENPLESIILLSARQFHENYAEAIAHLANNKKFAALKSFLKKRK